MLFRFFLALAFFSTQPGFCQLFDLKSLAMTAADKAFQGHTSNDNYPVEVINNPHLQDYVNSVREKLDPFAIHKKIPVVILKTSRIQGASIYGKEIDITRGMLNMIEDEAELACLIGHEIGHADLNHHLKTYKPDLADTLLTVGALTAANYAGVGDVAADVNKNRQSIMAAAWSQFLEEQADQYGAVLAAKAGYNPYALCDLFDRLMIKVKSAGIDQGIDLTSSHKSFEERSKILRKYLEDKGYKPEDGIRNKNEYTSGVAPIADIHTVEDLTNDQKKDVEDLKKIDDELSTAAKNNKQITPKRFLEIMNRYSQYIKKNHITRKQLLISTEQITRNSQPGNKITAMFMAATINQDSFFNPNSPNGLGPAGNFLVDGLGYAAKVGLGIAVPGASIAIGLYESATGKDLFTGESLSNDERLFSGLGALAGVAFQGLSLATNVEDVLSPTGTVKAIFDAASATHDSASYTAKAFSDLASGYNSGTNWQAHSYQNSLPSTTTENSESSSGQTSSSPIASTEDEKDLLNSNLDSLSFQTTQDTNYYWVQSGNGNVQDAILVDFNPSKYSASQLKNMLALKANPTGFSSVTVPKGTDMKISLINTGSKSGNVIGWKATNNYDSISIGDLVPLK